MEVPRGCAGRLTSDTLEVPPTEKKASPGLLLLPLRQAEESAQHEAMGCSRQTALQGRHIARLLIWWTGMRNLVS